MSEKPANAKLLRILNTMSDEDRKLVQVHRGVFEYFGDALVAVALLSSIGNEQHNPGEPLHWARQKSTEHAESLARHLTCVGEFDEHGIEHWVSVAWRGLAGLQTAIEQDPDIVDALISRLRLLKLCGGKL